MVNVNGNTVLIALGIIAATLVISSIIAMLIKDFRHKRQHRAKEKYLNAETDTRPIDVPNRGFSLLRALSKAARHRASAALPVASTTPSRGSSILRVFSRRRWRSKPASLRDLENQTIAYRTPTAAEIRCAMRSGATDSEVDLSHSGLHSPTGFYQSRGQQWARISLHSPPDTSDISQHNPSSPAPRVSEEVMSPLSTDLPRSADPVLSSVAAWCHEESSSTS